MFTAHSSYDKGAAREGARWNCFVFPAPCKTTARRAGGPELTLSLALVRLDQAGLPALGTSSQTWLLQLLFLSAGATSIVLALQGSKPCQDSLPTDSPVSHLPIWIHLSTAIAQTM